MTFRSSDRAAAQFMMGRSVEHSLHPSGAHRNSHATMGERPHAAAPRDRNRRGLEEREMRIVVVAGEPLVRAGIKAALESSPDLNLIAERGDARSAFGAIDAENPTWS